jgi:uncharacterized SAM-binding protein YcdF (DUF218 family)
MLFISKFFEVLAYPMGVFCLFACITIGLVIAKKKKIALICALISIFIIAFFACPLVACLLAKSLEQKFSQQIPGIQKASAIVLLGGFTRPSLPPRQHIEMGCGGDRLLQAVRLLKTQKASVIVCTGSKIPFLQDFPGSEATCMASLLRDSWGIDSSSIIIEDKALTTHDHGPRVAALLGQRGMNKDIILVTSAIHMYRSVKVFRKNGFTVFPAPVDFAEESRIQFSLFLFLPSVDALYESTAVLHEYYGIITYSILGWI